MKKIITSITFFIIIISNYSCGPSLPLVLNENNKMPLALSVNPLHITIGKSVKILVHYNWRGNKKTFEQKQGAVGDITYTITSSKFGGGRHIYCGEMEYDLQETGEFEWSHNSGLGGAYATGNGRVMFHVICSYKDKDGNKHKGQIGYLQIPVIFTKPY